MEQAISRLRSRIENLRHVTGDESRWGVMASSMLRDLAEVERAQARAPRLWADCPAKPGDTIWGSTDRVTWQRGVVCKHACCWTPAHGVPVRLPLYWYGS
jgi:hypothetical protein